MVHGHYLFTGEPWLRVPFPIGGPEGSMVARVRQPLPMGRGTMERTMGKGTGEEREPWKGPPGEKGQGHHRGITGASHGKEDPWEKDHGQLQPVEETYGKGPMVEDPVRTMSITGEDHGKKGHGVDHR